MKAMVRGAWGGRCRAYYGAVEEVGDGRREAASYMTYFTVRADPSGDFRRGAQFGSVSFRDGLREGIWPVGMVVERLGKRYVVEEMEVMNRMGVKVVQVIRVIKGGG